MSDTGGKVSRQDSSDSISTDVTDHPFSEYNKTIDTTIGQNFLGFDNARFGKQIKVDLNRFMFVLLTVWNNILGPQIARLWMGKSQQTEEDKKLISYVNMHVLTGESEPEEHLQRTEFRGLKKETKLLLLPEQQIIIFAVVFTNCSSYHKFRSSVPNARRYPYKTNCLSFVLPYQDIDRVVPLYSYLSQATHGIIDAMIRYPESEIITEITDMILNIGISFNNILNHSLINCKEKLTHRIDVKEKQLFFLKRCYQAVLQCGGFCLILGTHPDQELMKQMSIMISYIIPVKDKHCTVVPTSNHDQFMSHIYLQSLIYDDKLQHESNIRNRSIANKFPIAIIDVSRKTVHCSSSLERFFRNEYFSMKSYPIEKTGMFVNLLVDRMMALRNNEEFLKRLGALAIEDIKCKGELFFKLYDEAWNVEPIRVATELKWSKLDADIFIAWACRHKSRLKKKLYHEGELELSAVFGKYM